MKILLSLILFTCSGLAQYRNDMPEVAQPVHKNTSGYSNALNLSQQYHSVGNPRILVLLGRKLGSDSNEWQSDKRETISTMNRAYQGSNSSKDTRDTYRMTERRKLIRQKTTVGMRDFFHGFNDYMQSQNIPVLNYDSIMRQAQQKNELSGNIDRSTDKREIEADAVLSHADVLIEITDAGSITVLGKRVDLVNVTVTRMDSFETVANYLGKGNEYYNIVEQWLTDDSGYKKVQSIELKHSAVGFHKAEEMLTRAFSKSYEKKQILVKQGSNPTKAKIRPKKKILPPKN